MIILMLGGLFAESLTIAMFITFSSVAFGLSISGFIYLCIAVRCKTCGAKWIWLMATKRPGNPGYLDFRSDKCPVCGNTG